MGKPEILSYRASEKRMSCCITVTLLAVQQIILHGFHLPSKTGFLLFSLVQAPSIEILGLDFRSFIQRSVQDISMIAQNDHSLHCNPFGLHFKHSPRARLSCVIPF